MQQARDTSSPARELSAATLSSGDGLLPHDEHGTPCHENGADRPASPDPGLLVDSAPRHYEQRGGIACEQMERVLSHARRHGMDAAIDEVLGETIHASHRAHLREPTRVDWRLMLGMTRSDHVLDVGSGWGRLAFALAPWVGHLYSLEHVEQELEFQKIMLEERGDSNVTLMHGTILDLHDRPGALDWVIFNGVFATSPRTEGRDSLTTRQEMLARACSLLKPGGHVAICIGNRWGVDAFRPSRAGRGGNPLHPAHNGGLSVHRKLLTRAGFDEVRSFALLPHHSAPRAIIPIDPPCPPDAQQFVIDQVWRRASTAAALARALLAVLVRARVMRYFYPYYLLVGRKPC
jgi:SAM-dependent methyltransferase